MTTALADGYTAEVDTIRPEDWCEVIAGFSDGNLYQLWQHGSGPERFMDVSRLVLKRGGRVVAAAEVRTFRLPLMRRGIAYVLWGPVWKPRAGDADPQVFEQAVRALANEYVHLRGQVLRLNPRVYADPNGDEARLLGSEGFSTHTIARTKRSLLIDLSPTVEELRKQLDKKWRNCLSKAERSGLVIDEGTDNARFDEFVSLYARLLERKQFEPSADIQKHRRVQQSLPDATKMRVVLARQEGVPCAGALISPIGETAVYLFGATDESGMRTNAAYFVQWHVVNSLRAQGFKFYDLNGIDPEANPGVYHFKRGLAGRDGREVTFIGQFQAARPSVTTHSLLILEKLRQRILASRTRSAHASA